MTPTPHERLEKGKPMIQPSEGVNDLPCTCHPNDNPPKPCPKKYAYTECLKAAYAKLEQENADLRQAVTSRAVSCSTCNKMEKKVDEITKKLRKYFP